jgi:hypothetical protein
MEYVEELLAEAERRLDLADEALRLAALVPGGGRERSGLMMQAARQRVMAEAAVDEAARLRTAAAMREAGAYGQG